MRLERRLQELLHETANGVALGAHAPLFGHDIALFVELAEDGMKEALGLEVGPQFEAIRGKRVKVRRLIRCGERVHADGAGAIHDLAELVRDDILLRLVHRPLPRLLRRCDPGLIAADRLAALAVVIGIGLFHVLQRRFFFFVILRSYVRRSLERHVLEHMRQAGDPRHFLRRACIDHRSEREHGRFRSLHDDHREPIGQFADRGSLLC